MNFQQPMQNVQIPETVKNLGENISNTLEQAKTGMNTAVSGFSSQAEVGVAASQSFLQSNTIIAKFAFLILIIIAFIILLSLGIYLLNYFLSPPTNPYLIYGMVSGTSNKIVPSDPKNANSVIINRSNNQSTGLEFTWSVWLYINDLGTIATPKNQHIFNKGDTTFNSEGITKVNNSPGLYLQKQTDMGATTAQLLLIMDTPVTNNDNSTIMIDNIPIRKWVHVALRMENTIMDVYINGIVTQRLVLHTIPKQNYNDVNVGMNGGFNGNLSNLQYYSRALNAFEINNIVYKGPNLNAASESSIGATNASYLSSNWYATKM